MRYRLAKVHLARAMGPLVCCPLDAIGQMLGGPVVAVFASVGSAVASLVTSGLLLTPALFFIRRANSQSSEEASAEAEPLPAD